MKKNPKNTKKKISKRELDESSVNEVEQKNQSTTQNPNKKRELDIFGLIYALLLTIVFVFLISKNKIINFIELLKKIFGEKFVEGLSSTGFWIFGSITFLVIVFFILKLLIFKLTKKELSNWGYWTIALIIIVNAGGISLINNVFALDEKIEVYDLRFTFNNSTNNPSIQNNIVCDVENNQLIVNHKVNCSILSNLINRTEFVVFGYGNWSVKENMTHGQFKIPAGIVSIGFDMTGLNKNNSEENLSTGRGVKIRDGNENEKLKTDILKYTLGLFMVSIFSIPSMMVNLRNLFKKNNP